VRQIVRVWWAEGRMGEKSCAWLVGTRYEIERAKVSQRDRDKKERLRADGCPERAQLVP
jgi:hypothetical protein